MSAYMITGNAGLDSVPSFCHKLILVDFFQFELL